MFIANTDVERSTVGSVGICSIAFRIRIHKRTQIGQSCSIREATNWAINWRKKGEGPTGR